MRFSYRSMSNAHKQQITGPRNTVGNNSTNVCTHSICVPTHCTCCSSCGRPVFPSHSQMLSYSYGENQPIFLHSYEIIPVPGSGLGTKLRPWTTKLLHAYSSSPFNASIMISKRSIAVENKLEWYKIMHIGSSCRSVYFFVSKVPSSLNLDQPVSWAEDCMGHLQRTLTTDCSLWFSYIMNLYINIFTSKII